MSWEYFSDREQGPNPRKEENISASVWGGFVALLQSLISSGAFGSEFPKMCPDGAGPVGTDEEAMALAIKAEIPDIPWPLQTSVRVQNGFFYGEAPYAPDTLAILRPY